MPGGSRQNLETARELIGGGDTACAEALCMLLADAQTSGGLLLCVPPRRQEAVLAVLKTHRTPCAAVIGRMVRSGKPLIHVSI